MKADDLLDMIGNADDSIIEKADTSRNNHWIKYFIMAACLCLVVVAAISGLHRSPDNKSNISNIGGVTRKYKDVSIGKSEEALIWPWEYMTIYEQYSAINIDEKEYSIKSSQTVNQEKLSEKIGVYEASGYDIYTDKNYSRLFNVWSITGISSDLMIAAEMENQFYVFQNDEYTYPETLGEFLDIYSLQNNLHLSEYTEYYEGNDAGYYSLKDDNYIWEILDSCRDAQFAEDDGFGYVSRNRITFTATSEVLGAYKNVFYVSEDGYAGTNIFNWAYTYYIGEKAAKDIISYSKNNAVKAVKEPYKYSLAGILTEIGDGYILIDDSILCEDEKSGMVFKVLTDDIRIRRCVDYQKIETGSVVAVSFTEPIVVEEENVVRNAVSMDRAFIENESVHINE